MKTEKLSLNNSQMEHNSTLNNEVIPDPDFLEQIEGYYSKFSPEIVEMVAARSGMTTTDKRVYNVISLSIEIFMNKLLNEIYDVDNRNKKNLKTHLIYEELAMVLKDFNIDANCVMKFSEKRTNAQDQ